jgi:hypothetical protein
MCGIDPAELTPFQGGPVYWTVPGLKPLAAPVHKNHPTDLIVAPFGTGQIREKVKEGENGNGARFPKGQRRKRTIALADRQLIGPGNLINQT